MWEIQAIYSDYALDLITRNSTVNSNSFTDKVKRGRGVFCNWTSVSDLGELEDVIEKYDKGIRKDVRLYHYRLHNVLTDEAIPCEIL